MDLGAGVSGSAAEHAAAAGDRQALGTDNIPIPRYVAAVSAGEAIAGSTPFQVAARIASHSEAALSALQRLSSPGPDAELHKTLGDIRAMALLGAYYSAKIRGATELALFRATADVAQQQRAVQALTDAVRSWRGYTAQANAQYRNPVWTNRVGSVDWAQLTVEVDRDIETARAASALGASRAAR